MPTQNNGYSRRTEIIITTIINGIGTETNYKIYDYIDSQYIAITKEELLALSIADYNLRSEAFTVKLQAIYPTLVIDSFRVENPDCLLSGEMPTISYRVEYIDFECVLEDITTTTTTLPPTTTTTTTAAPICIYLAQNAIFMSSSIVTIRYYVSVDVAPLVNTRFSVQHRNYNNTANYTSFVTVLLGETFGYVDYSYVRLGSEYITTAYLTGIGYTNCGDNQSYTIPALTTTTTTTTSAPICAELSQQVVYGDYSNVYIKYTVTLPEAPSENKIFKIWHTNADNTYYDYLYITVLSGMLSGYANFTYHRQSTNFNANAHFDTLPVGYYICVDNLTTVIVALTTTTTTTTTIPVGTTTTTTTSAPICSYLTQDIIFEDQANVYIRYSVTIDSPAIATIVFKIWHTNATNTYYDFSYVTIGVGDTIGYIDFNYQRQLTNFNANAHFDTLPIGYYICGDYITYEIIALIITTTTTTLPPVCADLSQVIISTDSFSTKIRYSVTVAEAPLIDTVFQIEHTDFEGISINLTDVVVLSGELVGYFDWYYNSKTTTYDAIANFGIMPIGYYICIDNLTYPIPALPPCGDYKLTYLFEQSDEPYAIFYVTHTNDVIDTISIPYGIDFTYVSNVKKIEFGNNAGEVEYLGVCGSIFYLDITGDGNGTETGTGYYLAGTMGSFTATPNIDYSFVRWETCDTHELVTINANGSILMDSDKCLKAIYEFLPNIEIYFNNIIDRGGIDHINNGFDFTGKFPVIHGIADYKDIEQFVDSNFNVRGIEDQNASSFYNIYAPDQISKHTINTKIGYAGTTHNAFTYAIKISVVLGGENNITEQVMYNSGSRVVYAIGTPALELIANESIMAATTFLSGGATIELNSLLGSNSPKIINYITETLTSEVPTLLGEVLTVIGIIILVIQISDIIFDLYTESHRPRTGWVNYTRSTNGLYNNDSIKESKAVAKIGSNILGYSDVDNVLTSQSLNLTYTNNVSNEIIGFEYFPRGDQFDVSVPPPLVYYKVELIPLTGCRLSETKPIMFGFMVAPDKYAQPKFDIVPKNNTGSGNETSWNFGSYATFKDAMYCDYVLLNDLKSNNSRSGFFDFLGLVQTYHNFYIGTFGNDLHMSQNKIVYPNSTTVAGKYNKIQSKNFPMKIDDIFQWKVGEFTETYYESGDYEVIFANEKYPQLVMNHKFIDTYDVGDSLSYYMKKYWILGNGWSINNGALRKSVGVESTTYQALNKIEHTLGGGIRKKYRVVLDVVITSGAFYIDCTNTFDVALWNIPVGGNPISEPIGIVFDGNHIKITQTMRFNYFLTSTSVGLVDSKIKIGADSTTNGYITECTVQRLHEDTAGTNNRSFIPLKSYPINVGGASSLDLFLVFKCPYNYPDYTNSYFVDDTISFYIDVVDDYSKPQPYAVIDFGDGIIERKDLKYDLYDPLHILNTVSHTYTQVVGNEKIDDYVIKFTLHQGSQFKAFTCHSSGLVGIYDPNSILYDADLDLSETSIGYPSNMFYQLVKAKNYGINLSGMFTF